jgi:hypothetical protein
MWESSEMEGVDVTLERRVELVVVVVPVIFVEDQRERAFMAVSCVGGWTLSLVDQA